MINYVNTDYSVPPKGTDPNFSDATGPISVVFARWRRATRNPGLTQICGMRSAIESTTCAGRYGNDSISDFAVDPVSTR